MSSRTLLGAALVTTVSSAIALSIQVPSFTAPAPTTQAPPPTVQVDRQARSVAIDSATSYLDDHRSLLRAAPGDSFHRDSATAGSAGTWYVAYERSHRGLPVVGGDFVLAVNQDGKVTGRTSGQERVIRLASTTPRVRSAAARQRASGLVDRARSVTRPQLVVFAQGTPRLAWETVVTGRDGGLPTELTVHTDARTGQVIDSWDLVVEGTGNGYYNGSVTIGTSGSGSSYSMTDTARSGQKCGGQNGAAYTGTDNVWGNGAGTSLETGCVDALYAMNKEWDMLASWLGRSGIKGNGTGYPARVDLND